VIGGTLTATRARLGLAFTLAVPILPLGNLSLGLALAYAALAAGWLGLMWGDARKGLLFAVGIGLGPIGLLGVVPLLTLSARGTARRVAHTLAAVLVGGVAAGVHGWAVPFTGSRAASLAIAGNEHPVVVLHALWQWLVSTPTLGLEALILAATAMALPLAARGADLTIATFGAALLAATLLVAHGVGSMPLVLTGWATCVFLAVMSRRRDEVPASRRSFSALLAQTRATLRRSLSRVAWPGSPQRFGHAGGR
jgi:hypothetical protein